MQQLPSYGDQRSLAFCAFCGGETGAKDHCPSKVFLDSPYPEQLPVVPACSTCNAGFSVDEEYLACLISCVIAGSTDPNAIPREKTSRILKDKPALRAKLEQARSESDSGTTFNPEHERISAVLTKLAQGHALYELHESCARKPDEFWCVPLTFLNDIQLEDFENPESDANGSDAAWPEVGSRAMQRILIAGTDALPSGWLNVQPGRYRYHVTQGVGTEVRIVIHEYLACFASWEY